MKKFLTLVLLILSFAFAHNRVFSQEQNIYFTAYMNRLQNKVYSNWIIPHGETDKKTIITFDVDRNGKILKANVTETSGDEDFDKTALTAVYKSVPFEHLPKSIKDNNIKILFTFNQNCFETKSVLNSQIIKENCQKNCENKLTQVSKSDLINQNNKNEKNCVNFKPYMNNLEKQIKLNWKPPRFSESKRVVAFFKIQKDGTLVEPKIYKSSGNQNYDQKALAAIYASSPFKPLPQNFNGSSVDIQFTFDYNIFGIKNYNSSKDNINTDLNTTASKDYQKIIKAILYHSLPKKVYFREKCLILKITINKSGKIDSIKVIHSSNDKKFDNFYISAIKKCSFPPIPDSLMAENFSINYIVSAKRSNYEPNYPFHGSFWFLLGMMFSSVFR